jgi:EAL domain-containing protein (putative c-di-GMP-specific phosphodiesterase class I)
VLAAGASALADHAGPASLDLLVRLRVKGFGLCLEAFDGGHPSPARLPLTHAELPAQLVATAAVTGDHARLTHAIDAARGLGVPVVGHCATRAEFELLLRLGCSLAHGPFLAPPVAVAELAHRVRTWEAPVR